MEKKMKKVLSFLLPVVLGIAITAKTTEVKADTVINNIGVQYQTHVQSTGWQKLVSDGQAAGTVGRSLRVEASKIKLVNAPAGASIKYQAHVQNVGWQNWVSDGSVAGTVGKSLRVEAIKIILENMPGYSVQYQAHVQGIGWQNWVSDGSEAGTHGKSLRVEGIRIRIVKISDNTKVNVQYQGHVQNIGWQSLAFNGQISGTEGLSLREEAYKIKLVNAPAGASIKYQTHVQSIGWQKWVSNGIEAGTNGKSLRVEAIKITLENMPGYSVQYQAHVQNIGWMNWVSNGQEAGTHGKSLRVEALRVRIVHNAVHPESVKLNKTTDTLAIGDTDTLSAIVAPSNADNKNVTWISSDNAVAAVDNTGKVTAVGSGTAAITAATADGGKTASCTVTCNTVSVSSVNITVAADTLRVGNSHTLTAAISPSNATNKKVNWTSSDKAVAAVDSSGRVTGVSEGTATITATTADGGKIASCIVTVSLNCSNFRALIMSDIHYDSTNYFNMTKEDRANYIINCINSENAERPLDMVIIDGDCSSTNTTNLSSSLTWYTDFVKNYLSRLKVPYYVLHGNHDEVTDKQWPTFFKTQKNFTIVDGQYAFICVDNFNGGFSANRGSGYAQSPVDMTWFNQQAENLKDKKVIVVGHYMANSFDTKLIDAINNTSNIICAFDAHEHNLTETVLDSGKKIYMDGVLSYGLPDSSSGFTGYWCYKNLEVREGNLIEETVYPKHNYPACTNVDYTFNANNQAYTVVNKEVITPVHLN